jgi:hypothetical protein
VAVISIVPIMLQTCWCPGVKKLALRGVPKFSHMYRKFKNRAHVSVWGRKSSSLFAVGGPIFAED